MDTDPSFDGNLNCNKYVRRSPLPFLGNSLSWLTGTATTKDINSIKERVNQLITAQTAQQETIVHIVSILNVTRYATQVNRQHINIIMDAVDKTVHDINNLYNITTLLYTSLSYYQLVLYIRSVLSNLQDSLSYIRTVSMHTMHLPVSSEDTLHFYRYLHTHVLIANRQFLLLIDIPIQDHMQQLSVYKIFTMDIPHGNFTAQYDINA